MRKLAFILFVLAAAAGVYGAGPAAAADSLRAAALAEELAMNAPGSMAADFGMELAGGGSARLSDFRGEPLLLVLFDPDCDHCMQVVAGLAERVPAGLRVLAVYADGDEALRPRAVALAPEGWTVAFDDDGVYSSGLYSPEFVPGIYLLDADGLVQARGESIEFGAY